MAVIIVGPSWLLLVIVSQSDKYNNVKFCLFSLPVTLEVSAFCNFVMKHCHFLFRQNSRFATRPLQSFPLPLSKGFFRPLLSKPNTHVGLCDIDQITQCVLCSAHFFFWMLQLYHCKMNFEEIGGSFTFWSVERVTVKFSVSAYTEVDPRGKNWMSTRNAISNVEHWRGVCVHSRPI